VTIGAAIFAADWPTTSGSPQREGWARSEKVITKDNVHGLDVIYRYQSDNKSRGLYSLTSPLIDGMLITYRGFKEMLVFGGSSDVVYSVDADLNRLIWERHFEYEGEGKKTHRVTATCPGGLTAAVAMDGSSSAGVSFGRRPAAPAPGGRAPIGGRGFGSLGAFFAVSSDGYLHTLNASTGEDLIPAAKFLPPNSRVSALNVYDDHVYAATSGACGGANAVYGIDMASTDKKVFTFPVAGNSVAGASGTALGSDGTVYVQVPAEQGQTDTTSHRTVLALDPENLGVKDFFVAEDAPSTKGHADVAGPAPMVFSWKGKDVVVAAGSDGRIYLLDSASLGGPDHHKPMFESEPVASADEHYAGSGFRTGFATWSDAASDARWLYASLWGPPRAAIKFPQQNGDVSTGGIVGFKVEDKGGQPVLAAAWISPNIASPAAPVIASGMVFALSTGDPMREAKPNGKPYSVGEVEKTATPAALYALDGETGKQLYTSGAMSSPAYSSGLAVANGRIYFGTSDNNMNAFGFKAMQPQLTDK
jgi:outer membrane protein assembly factor BamB